MIANQKDDDRPTDAVYEATRADEMSQGEKPDNQPPGEIGSAQIRLPNFLGIGGYPAAPQADTGATDGPHSGRSWEAHR